MSSKHTLFMNQKDYSLYISDNEEVITIQIEICND